VFTAYLIVTLLAAAANIFSATLDFIRFKPILINMAKAGVSESWLTTLGILKATGALGLLVGIKVPLIGTAAAIGLVLRWRDHNPPSCTRLLVRLGRRLSLAGHGGAGIEACRAVKKLSA
jgi:hypothetical protein